MSIRRGIIIALGAIVGVMGACASVRAYDTYVLHPKLSRAVAAAYGEGNDALTGPQAEWLTQGSLEEDEPAIRVLNHFYDPQSGRPLTVAGVKLGLPSPEWLTASFRQSLIPGRGDCSWPRALYEYQHGNEALAFICLGHALHLLEDASVPAHVRNDDHLEGDSYESWLKYNNPELMTAAAIEPDCGKAADCIRQLAQWTNTHFLSEDTISATPYAEPFRSAEISEGYLQHEGRKLAAYNPKSKSFRLNSEIQAQYWREISPVLVAYGRRLIEVFMSEASGAAAAKPVTLTNKATELVWNVLEPAGNIFTETDAAAKRFVASKNGDAVADETYADTAAPEPQLSPEGLKVIEGVEDPGGQAPALAESVSSFPSQSRAAPNGHAESEGDTESEELPGSQPDSDPAPETEEPSPLAVPDTFMTTRPASLVNETSAVFTLASDIPAAGFECSRNGSNWETCSTDYRLDGLQEGTYWLYARALFEGRRDETPIEYHWSVDLSPPLTLLLSDTAADERTALFRFMSEADSRFECSLDGELWAECESPREYGGLAAGEHEFSVRAVDKVGNIEPVPATHTWNIEIQASPVPLLLFPAVTPYYTNQPFVVLNGIAEVGTNVIINDRFEADSIDGTNWSSRHDLSPGVNAFSMRSENDYGEKSEAYVQSVILDTQPPTAEFIDVPTSYDSVGFSLRWRGSDNESAPLEFEVQYRAGDENWQDWQPRGPSTEAVFNEVAATGVPLRFRVRAFDTAGNVGEWSAVTETELRPLEPSASLVALWHFDECAGAISANSAGAGTSVPFTASTWTVGKFGCGMNQDPRDPWLRWSLPEVLPSESEFTVSFFVNNIYSYSSGELWFINSDGNFTAGIMPRPDGTQIRHRGQLLNFTDMSTVWGWHHMTVVYSADYLAWYVDGNLLRKLPGDYRQDRAMTDLYIRQNGVLWQLDELSVWSRALTDAEVAVAASRQLSPRLQRPAQAPAQLIHYWDFDAPQQAYDPIGGVTIYSAARQAGRRGLAIESNWRDNPLSIAVLPDIVDKDVSISYWRLGTGIYTGTVRLADRLTDTSFGASAARGYESVYWHNGGRYGLGLEVPGDNNWHHVAVVYDSYAYEVRYYLDGIERVRRPHIWQQVPLNQLLITEEQGGSLTDDLKIFAGALTAAEVGELAGE